MGDQPAHRQPIPGASHGDSDLTEDRGAQPKAMNPEAEVPFYAQIPVAAQMRPPQQLQHQHQHQRQQQPPVAYTGNTPIPMMPYNYNAFGPGAFDMGQMAGALPPVFPPNYQSQTIPIQPSPTFPPAQHAMYHRFPGRQQADGSSYARQAFNPQYAHGQHPHLWSSDSSRGSAVRTINSHGQRGGSGSYPKQSDKSAPPPVITRGPPRKPRQSGHALWVGNLPPNATVTDLKDHFSREATDDIESLKLISKSNCAFVNYRTAESCQAAMERFHDSRFHGARLVCRLRRTSSVSAAFEPGSSDGVESANTQPETPTSPAVTQGEDARSQEDWTQGPDQEHTMSSERYFVLKSLTLRDLEMSTRNGIWATQAHNETILNEAYKSADSVYLIFSANKSGEYFGYARMVSEVPAPGLVHKSSTPDEPSNPLSGGYTVAADQGPRILTTPATEWAPKGRIIDDSARGTIFWEADRGDEPRPAQLETKISRPQSSPEASDEPVIASSDSPSAANTDDLEGDDSSPAMGRYFRVEWRSTRKVPFYKTRGLRNPWNLDREMKIARDGTEIEPRAAKKLLALFGPRPTPSTPSAT